MEIIPGLTLDEMEAEVPVVELHPLKGKPYGEIVFMGDFHIGSHFSERQYLEYVKYILSKKGILVGGMGDYIELASLSRYSPAEQELTKIQLEEAVRILAPLKNRIFLLLEGNHEERFWKSTKGTESVTSILASRLRIKPLLPGPERGQLFVVKVGKGKTFQYYPVYAIHGFTSATVRKDTQLKRIFGNIRVSLIVHAHIHQIYKDHRTYYSVRRINDKFYLTCHEQYWLTTGCFVKNLGYAEKRSYPVTKIGAPFVRFYWDREGIEIVDDPRITYNIGLHEVGKPRISLSSLRRRIGLPGNHDVNNALKEYKNRMNREVGFGNSKTILGRLRRRLKLER